MSLFSLGIYNNATKVRNREFQLQDILNFNYPQSRERTERSFPFCATSHIKGLRLIVSETTHSRPVSFFSRNILSMISSEYKLYWENQKDNIGHNRRKAHSWGRVDWMWGYTDWIWPSSIRREIQSNRKQTQQVYIKAHWTWSSTIYILSGD